LQPVNKFEIVEGLVIGGALELVGLSPEKPIDFRLAFGFLEFLIQVKVSGWMIAG
jgi:hypothetical protein